MYTDMSSSVIKVMVFQLQFQLKKVVGFDFFQLQLTYSYDFSVIFS